MKRLPRRGEQTYQAGQAPVAGIRSTVLMRVRGVVLVVLEGATLTSVVGQIARDAFRASHHTTPP